MYLEFYRLWNYCWGNHITLPEQPSTISLLSSLMDTVSTWTAIISSLAAVGGLFYVGRQFHKNAQTTRQAMYVTWLDKYLHLNELILTHPKLRDIYTGKIAPSDLSAEQRH